MEMKLAGQREIERETELRDKIWELTEKLSQAHKSVAALRQCLAEIVDDASPCTSACSRLVDEKLIEKADRLS